MQLDFNQGKTIYVVDTSALIILESTFKYDNPVFKAIWEEIEELISQGAFITIDFVEEEIISSCSVPKYLSFFKTWHRF